MAPKANMIDRLAPSPEEARAVNCRDWAASIPDTTPIAGAASREHCRVAGVIKNIRIDPREGTGSVEATISDGSGELVAKWLGRRSLAGLKLGKGLVLDGIAGGGDEDRLVVLNPEYELVAGPEHG